MIEQPSAQSTLASKSSGGAEVELEMKYGLHKLRFSQAYTKLLDFDLYTTNTLITAKPFGYGDDLADGATHSSKLWYTYQANERTRATSTLRSFWGDDGSRDYRDKRLADGVKDVRTDWEKAYKEQVYLNFGVQHNPSDTTTLTVQLHNVLGLIDKDLNTRALRSLGDCRAEAVAISVGLVAKF